MSFIPNRMPGKQPDVLAADLRMVGIREEVGPFSDTITRLALTGRIVIRGGQSRPFQYVKGLEPCVVQTPTLTDTLRLFA
jgi:hypothetical protein